MSRWTIIYSINYDHNIGKIDEKHIENGPLSALLDGPRKTMPRAGSTWCLYVTTEPPNLTMTLRVMCQEGTGAMNIRRLNETTIQYGTSDMAAGTAIWRPVHQCEAHWSCAPEALQAICALLQNGKWSYTRKILGSILSVLTFLCSLS